MAIGQLGVVGKRGVRKCIGAEKIAGWQKLPVARSGKRQDLPEMGQKLVAWGLLYKMARTLR